jgi:hypothetical protein
MYARSALVACALLLPLGCGTPDATDTHATDTGAADTDATDPADTDVVDTTDRTDTEDTSDTTDTEDTSDTEDTTDADLDQDGFPASVDCDDADRAVNPDATELCNGVDDDCDDLVDRVTGSACADLAGDYAGTYSVRSVLKAGNTTVHDVTCEGTFDLAIDLSASPVVQGTADCSYGGSLGGFASHQHATLEGTLAADGTVALDLAHVADSSDATVYIDVAGTADGQDFAGTGETASWYPTHWDTVPWTVTATFGPE